MQSAVVLPALNYDCIFEVIFARESRSNIQSKNGLQPLWTRSFNDPCPSASYYSCKLFKGV